MLTASQYDSKSITEFKRADDFQLENPGKVKKVVAYNLCTKEWILWLCMVM